MLSFCIEGMGSHSLFISSLIQYITKLLSRVIDQYLCSLTITIKILSTQYPSIQGCSMKLSKSRRTKMMPRLHSQTTLFLRQHCPRKSPPVWSSMLKLHQCSIETFAGLSDSCMLMYVFSTANTLTIINAGDKIMRGMAALITVYMFAVQYTQNKTLEN